MDIKTVENYLRDQEKKLYNLEHHINRMTRQFGKREKLLLSEMAKLHNELRDQTIKFQKNFSQSSLTTVSLSSSSSYNELPPVEEEVRLRKIFLYYHYYNNTFFARGKIYKIPLSLSINAARFRFPVEKPQQFTNMEKSFTFV